MLRLAEGMIARGVAVDFVVGRAEGELLGEVPPGARIVPLTKAPVFWAPARARVLVAQPSAWRFMLKPRHRLKVVKPLLRWMPCVTHYLRRARPDAVLAAEPRYNLLAVWGRRLSGLDGRVLVSERIQVSRHAAGEGWWADASLKALVGERGVADDVAMIGFVDNPFAFMARASVFALSSLYEGLPGVLIQALACGCPVVSTDCPSGPREILDHGRFGPLVPVGDEAALARAIEAMLDDPPPTERLRARAGLFSVQRAVDSYLKLLFPVGEKLAGRAAA